MKTKSVVFILLLILIITNCKKPDNDLIPNFTVLKDGSEWNPTFCTATYYLTNKEVEIHCLKRISKYYEDELFNLSFNIENVAELITINEFNSTWLFVLGGDGISNRYNIVSDALNSIQIISFDTIKKQLTGTFNVKLLRDKFYQHPEDTMLFSDGKFSLKYLEAYGYVNTSKSE